MLGDIWLARGPFFGTAVLMAIGFILIATLLGPVAQARESRVSIADPLRALSHGGLRSMAIVAVLYNFGFFTILGLHAAAAGDDRRTTSGSSTSAGACWWH